MASKKNPLSAMLNSDRRVQAREFQRQFTVSSTVKGAGDYAIGVTKPLPVSQTSMGRLSEALGAASGLLKEFSDYQIQKDQLDLQSEALKNRIQTQEIAGEKAKIDLENSKLRGAVTNETIKQQNIKLEMLQQQQAVAEFNEAFDSLTPEEQRDFQINTEITTRKAEQEKDKALGNAAIAVSRGGTEEQQLAFKEIYAKRKKGAGLLNEYVEFFQSEKAKILAGIRVENLSTEEANAIGEEILDDYIATAELEEGTEERKGFLMAASAYNQKNIPSLASEAKSRASAIGYERQGFQLFNTVKNGDSFSLDEITELQLNADEGSFLPVLFGEDGKSGLLGRLKDLNDPDALENFSDNFLQLGELEYKGKPFKESSVYSSSFAAVDEAIQAAEANEIKKEDLKDKLAFNESQKAIYKLTSSDKTLEEQRSKLLDLPLKNPTKEGVLEVYPELAVALEDVTDEKLAGFLTDFRGRYLSTLQDYRALGDQFIKEHSSNYVRLDSEKNASSLFKSIITEISTITGEGAAESNLLNDFLTRGSLGGLGFNEVTLSNFDQASGGIFEKYTEELNDLPEEVRKRFENVSSPEAEEFLKGRLGEIDERLERGIKDFAKTRIVERERLKKQAPVYATPEEIASAIEQNPQASNEEIKELILKSKKKTPSSTVVTPEQKFKSDEKLREFLEKNSYTDRNSPRAKEFKDITLRLLTRNLSNFNPFSTYFYQEEGELYETALKQAESIETNRIILGVRSKELLNLAQTAASLPSSQVIPLVMKEDTYDSTPLGGGALSRDVYAKKAQEVLKDITISKGLFVERTPPLIDLKLGKKEPTDKADVTKAAKDLGFTESQLLDVARLYGHDDVISFLKAQYKTNYHTNKR